MFYENTVRCSIRLLQSTRLNRRFSLLNRPPHGCRWVQYICSGFREESRVEDWNVRPEGDGTTTWDQRRTRTTRAPGTWTATGSMNHPREVFTATLLNNGKVLVAGGADTSSSATSSAELYDSATGALDTHRKHDHAPLWSYRESAARWKGPRCRWPDAGRHCLFKRRALRPCYGPMDGYRKDEYKAFRTHVGTHQQRSPVWHGACNRRLYRFGRRGHSR